MTKLSKKNQKRLAKLVALTLMCTGGLCSLPSVASAEEVTVTNVTANGPLAYAVTSDPADGMNVPPGSSLNTIVFFPKTANVLNITGTFDATTSGLGGIKFYGGYNEGASGKTVNITGTGTDIAVGTIAGGWANGNYSVTGNHVNFLGGTTTVSQIYGGDGVNGANVSKNHVNIAEGSTIKYTGYGVAICGGMGLAGSGGGVDANTVTISGTLATAVPSAYLEVTVAGGAAETGDGKNVTGNMVEIKGATFDTGAIDNVAIYGGYNTATNGNATGNTVTISGNSTFGENTAYIYGGFSQSGAANDNTVEISGGTINGYIYGGMGSTEASGNTVTISGDAIINALDSAYIYGGTGAPIVKNNTINILTQISVKGLYGGIDSGAGDGNTLNVNATGVTVGDDGINGFQNMNFFLPEGAAGKTMLTVNAKDVDGSGMATDLKGVAIGAAVQTGAKFNKGDTVNLITNPSGLLTDETTTMKQITDETVTIQTKPTAKTLTTDQSYKLGISKQGETTIVATVTDIEEKQNEERTEQAKSLIETRAAATTFVNSGADMLASQGFNQAANAVALEAAEKAKDGAASPSANAFTPFAAIGGSGMRAETGSYVKTKGFGLNVGFAREIANSQGKLLFGPVVEYGGGSYDSYLEDAAGTHGDGGAHYYGLGLMARQVNHDGLYYEGSIRGGRVKADFNSTLDQLGKVNYDSSSTYWAAHLGVGKVFSVGSNNKLDGYLKYFYSHQAGDTTTVHIQNAADESARFDSVDSNRIRVGARLTHKVNDQNSFYGGLAYQYEFGGEARAHFAGSGAVPSPSLKGSSGMMELGWQYKKNNVTVDLGMNGWIGKQRGLSAQLGATWTF